MLSTKTRSIASMSELSASQQIDTIITMHSNWKGEMLAHVRSIILQSNPAIVEEVKWKMKNRPEGLAVWTHNGTLCFMEIWNNNVKLLFPKGAQLSDPHKVFNARLQSKDIRAIELKEHDTVDTKALQALIGEAISLNG